MKNQHKSHPLKWTTLVDVINRSGLNDPDIWIEDLREYGACFSNGVEEKGRLVCEDEGTLALEASFSVITDADNNRIIIRHHF